MRLKKDTNKTQEPEILDDATLTAIDQAERWEAGKEAVTFDEALKRARKRHYTWQNTQLDRSA